MQKDLVTVVLPIYNTEKYLNRCIDSIVNQTYSNLEILLVDDGSPDNCPAMCDAWAEKDSRIKVIHKSNSGLGMARNTGIDHATGEYICFFDSDDYISLDTVEKTYILAKKEQSDIVIFGLSNVDKSGNVVNSIVPQTDKVTYTGDEVQKVFLPDLITTTKSSQLSNLYMSACVCLFSRKLLQKCQWRFVSEREIISEDVYSLLCLYKHVENVSVLPEALYFYCENGTSLTHTYRKDRFERICYFHQRSALKARELGYGENVLNRLQEPFASFVISAMKMIVRADCREKEKWQELKKIVYSDYLKSFQWDDKLKNPSTKRNIFMYFLRKRMLLSCYVLMKLSSK